MVRGMAALGCTARPGRATPPLAIDALRPTSEVTTAIYDPPTVVVPWLRRNEVWVEVARP